MRKILAGIAFLLSGCIIIPSPPQSDLFQAKTIETKNLSIAVWEKNDIQKGQPLRLYFEGDGNPNPRYKVAFDLAEADQYNNVIYIARPCQWVEDKKCAQTPAIYKESRFHPEIMQEMQELVSYLMRKYNAPSLELIGYDGGAVIALNLASKLPTKRIITIAGITDINAYNLQNDLPQQDESEIENPAQNLNTIATISQIHYVGQNDDITPRRLVERFVARMQNPRSAVVKVVPDTGHTDWRSIKLDY